MTIYNTNISKDYAIGAGFSTAWSGVREILQNGLDGRDRGYFLRISHGRARDRSGQWALKIVNEGVTLTRDALVLGFSTKQNDDGQRGEHGEGLVVGINALLNNGHKVWIRTGNEVWQAKYETNENGLELLVIDIKKQRQTISDFIVEIQGITPDEWSTYQDRILFFDENCKKITCTEGSILLDSKYKNQLFVKGIYVGQLPDNYTFGYDLPIHLNRDREVANPWHLRTKVRDTIAQVLEGNQLSTSDILNVLENESCGETLAFAEEHWYDSYGFAKKIANDFVEKHGEDAIPVCSIGDSQRTDHFGSKGISVAHVVKKIIERIYGKLEDRLAETALEIKKPYQWTDLEEEETDNIADVIRMVGEVEPSEVCYWDIVHIVDFVGDNIRGRADTKGGELEKIYIARRICDNQANLLRTLVHEIAHKYAGDGDIVHTEQQLRILSEIAVRTT